MMAMLDHALDYARRGWPVFPCDQDKQPLVPRDLAQDSTPIPRSGGLYKATTDETTIRKWWAKWPDAMIGFPCGPASGVWGLDPDVPKKEGQKDGLAYWRKLAAEHGGAPITHSHITPSGGLHMLYRWRDDKPVSNKEGKLKGTGINVRGNGGYMIAPPSRRADGKVYQIAEELDFFRFADAPDWLYDLILPPNEQAIAPAMDTRSISERARAAVRPPEGVYSHYVDAAVEGERAKVVTAGSGTRNNELNTAAFNLGTLVGAGVLSEQDAGTVLMDAARHNGLMADDGERSVVATISSGLSAGIQKPRQLPAPDRSAGNLSGLLEKANSAFSPPADLAGVERQARGALPKPALPPIKATPFILRDPKLIPTRQFLYGRHYIRKFVSITVAPGGLGKSSLVITEALAMATGRNLIGTAPAEQLKVWLWNGEDPIDELERRIAATALHYDVDGERIAERLFVDTGREMEIVIAEETKDGTTIARPVVDALVAVIREHKIDVVMIDPFVSSHRVSENDNNAIDTVAKTWARIADMTGCAVELVHHVRKTAPGQEIGVEDGRGASALLAAARSARVLNPMTAAESTSFQLESHKGYFRLGVGKANLAPPPDKDDWFKMQSVSLGNGPQGMLDLGDKVGVVTVWMPPDPMANISTEDLAKAQSACANQRWRDNEQANDWAGFPIGRALGLDLGTGKANDMTKPQKANKAKVKNLLRIWIQNGAFVRVQGFDERRKERTFIEVGDTS